MDSWQKWKKTEHARLACYVHADEAFKVFGAPEATFDDRSRRADILRVVRRLYYHLLAKGIHYDTALIDFSDHHEAEQVIRQPDEVRGQGGNCLELTLVFAALCQRLRIYPVVVLLEGHALLAVLLDESVERVVATGRPATHNYELLSGGMLRSDTAYEPTDKVLEWVDASRLVLVECTALARTTQLNGPNGTLSFDDAVRAGTKVLMGKSLVNMIDVSYLHRNGYYKPYRPTPPVPQAVTADLVLGAAAAQVVEDALGRTPDPPDLPGKWNVMGIDSLLPVLRDSHERLRTTLTDLRLALNTTQFLRTWMPAAFATRERLAAAIPECGFRPLTDRDAGLGDYVEHVALHRPFSEKDAGPALVSFVASVAIDAGLDVGSAAFTAWADSVTDRLVVNDRIARVRRRRTSIRRRLVLALRGSLTGWWPESVDAWLMDGDEVLDTYSEPCRRPDQQSVEKAIATLVRWAQNRPGERVIRVEVAVPTPLLARWRPEEVKVGSRLAVHHDVVVRWSGRMDPVSEADAADAVFEAEARWPEVLAGGPSQLLWLDRASTADKIADGFERGAYQGGFGLRFVPHGHDDLVRTILTYTPVLLMPLDEGCSWDDVEDAVNKSWHDPLAATAEAFRARLQTSHETAKPVPALATTRLVWEDSPWLAFCRDVRPQRAKFG